MSNIFVDVWDIEKKKINTAEALEFVADDINGAFNLFLGAVRNHNHGQKVLGVSYDVHNKLAINNFREICKEAQEKWGDNLKLYVVHAKGRLNIGDLSIAIAVGSKHRDESFQACRYIIEEIKKRSPVWKLEHYVNGDSEWTKGCELCHG